MKLYTDIEDFHIDCLALALKNVGSHFVYREELGFLKIVINQILR